MRSWSEPHRRRTVLAKMLIVALAVLWNVLGR